MPATERPVSSAVDFPGLITDIDPRDLPAGAAEEQVNLACIRLGEMQVRGGLREVSFDEE